VDGTDDRFELYRSGRAVETGVVGADRHYHTKVDGELNLTSHLDPKASEEMPDQVEDKQEPNVRIGEGASTSVGREEERVEEWITDDEGDGSWADVDEEALLEEMLAPWGGPE
jgi:hypothetical protein